MALDRMSPYQYQIIAGIIYTLAIPLWIYVIKKSDIVYTSGGVWYAIIGTLIYMAGGMCFNFLIKGSNNLGAISAMTSLSPVITLFLSFLFLGEKITVFKMIAFVLAMMSAILINY